MKSMKTIYYFLLTVFILFIPEVYSYNVRNTAKEIQPESVLDFGVKGDSITDDTEVIQRAVDSGDGQLIFPSGSYRLTDPVHIDLGKVGPVALKGHGTARILMEGAGPAFKFVGTHQGTANPSIVKQNV